MKYETEQPIQDFFCSSKFCSYLFTVRAFLAVTEYSGDLGKDTSVILMLTYVS